MLIVLLPALVAIGGAFVYALAANPKAQEMGRLAFAIGLFFVVYALGSHVIKIG